MSSKNETGLRLITRRRVLGLGAAAVAGTAVWQWNEVDNLTIERKTLRLPRWRAHGFRIALLSDFHANVEEEGHRAAKALRMAVLEKPDVILLGGDYIDSDREDALPSLEIALNGLRETQIPVFAVLGNHDFWVSSTAQIIEMLKNKGIRLLRNEIVAVDDVALWGIDDGIEKKDRHDTLTDRLDTGSVLALFHEPDFVERVDRRIGLMLSGHSHGGQICLPFGVPMHTPGGARKYKRGFYPEAKVPLYVTRGIGTVGPRKRAFCSPEIAILTLSS